MKTLTPAERACRAAGIGITLPAPAKEALPSQANVRQTHEAAPPQPRPAGKLAATHAMRRRAIAAQPPELAPTPPQPAAEARKLTGASYEHFTRVRGLLQARYPQIFSWGRPLAMGIDQKLREAFTEEELPTADLKVFLRIWVAPESLPHRPGARGPPGQSRRLGRWPRLRPYRAGGAVRNIAPGPPRNKWLRSLMSAFAAALHLKLLYSSLQN